MVFGWQVDNEATLMSNPEPLLVKAANVEFNRWANFLFRRPYTTQVVAEFIDEIKDAFETIQNHPDRYPLEGYSDYRKFGPTPKHHLKSFTRFGMR
jgi:hypothetical protein